MEDADQTEPVSRELAEQGPKPGTQISVDVQSWNEMNERLAKLQETVQKLPEMIASAVATAVTESINRPKSWGKAIPAQKAPEGIAFGKDQGIKVGDKTLAEPVLRQPRPIKTTPLPKAKP